MIKPDLTKWEYKEDLKGLLIFAQAIDEMLFHHTIDTYKATALSVRTNILELRYLANQSRNNTKTMRALEPVIEELDVRLRNDPLIKPKYPKIFHHYFQRIKRLKSRPEELISLLNVLLSELDSFYWKDLLLTIEEKVANPQLKNDIITLANIFIVEAEFFGFSRSFVYYQSRNFFFRPDISPEKINSVNQIKDFLRFFTQESANWQVVFKVEESYKELIEYAKYFSVPDFKVTIGKEEVVGVPIKSKSHEKFLNEKKSTFPLFISIDISKALEIKEPISVRDAGKTALDTLFDVYSFVTHKEQPQIFDNALILNKDSVETHFLQPSPNPMKCGIQKEVGINAKSETELFIDIVNSKHFDHPSTQLIIQSLNFHRAALEAKTPENQLLDLWAALEGFLPSSGEEPRIISVMDALIPSLILTYPEKIFNYVAENVYYSGGKCRDLVNSIDVGDDFFKKFVALLVCDDLVDKRKELYSSLENHPLLCHRIYQIYESFKSKKKIKETLLTHREKISWHIQRIYTSRNQIIHNAKPLPYLSTLVENLHFYFDILIETTSVVALISPNKINIASALQVLGVREQSYLHELEGEDLKCTKENYGNLVFGTENPINPFNGISFFESSFK